jgi:D-beta-D-heptose 7-phosphate kinase/D-beta-D-heptose 1-phosphate adenosyltransferase
VIGDIMLDRYLWGQVTRISPEAPVPVVEVESETLRLGGAANVAQNVLAFSARPVLVGVTGDDAVARSLRGALEEVSLPVDGLVADSGRPTTLKTRIVARGQHVVRADQEDRTEIAGDTEDAVWARVQAGLASAGAVVISDYGKGVVTKRLLERLLPAAKDRGIPVCVDPKDIHFNSYRGVAVITPNQLEAAEVLGYKLRGDAALDRAGWDLRERLDADSVLITRGEHGMSLFENGGRRTDFPVVARRVYDVTGAGDTVVSSYAVALAGGAEAREAALIATHAAGLVVAEVGTAVPTAAGLRASFREEA